jgi:predicted Zn-dependent protease
VGRQIPVIKKSALCALLAAVALTAAFLIKSSETLAGYVAKHTSIPDEIRLVKAAVDELNASTLPSSHPDALFVNRVATQLTSALPADSPYRNNYHFQIIASGEINAFALPGASIYVYTGLLDHLDRRPDLVAAVLAHEIEHVEQRHGLQSAYRSMSLGAITLWTFGLSSDLGSALTNAVINSRYSRQFESEADKRGLALLSRAGVRAQAMPEALLRLATARQGWQAPAWLSSHPAPKDRARNLEKQLNTKVY